MPCWPSRKQRDRRAVGLDQLAVARFGDGFLPRADAAVEDGLPQRGGDAIPEKSVRERKG